MRKKALLANLLLVLLLPLFSFQIAAKNNSWQEAYFKLLTYLRTHPGFIRILLDEKDKNGFKYGSLHYALCDFDQDGVPELVVWGLNNMNEAGDNYQVYTYEDGKAKLFKIVSRKGSYYDQYELNEIPKDQLYWPFMTEFFFLPDGYLHKPSGELKWIMLADPNNYKPFAVASTPQFEQETIFEASFDFENHEVSIETILYYELLDEATFKNKLAEWKDTHEAAIINIDKGHLVSGDPSELWQELLAAGRNYPSFILPAETTMPKLGLMHTILSYRNRVFSGDSTFIDVLIIFGTLPLILLVVAITLPVIIVKNRRRKGLQRTTNCAIIG